MPTDAADKAIGGLLDMFDQSRREGLPWDPTYLAWVEDPYGADACTFIVMDVRSELSREERVMAGVAYVLGRPENERPVEAVLVASGRSPAVLADGAVASVGVCRLRYAHRDYADTLTAEIVLEDGAPVLPDAGVSLAWLADGDLDSLEVRALTAVVRGKLGSGVTPTPDQLAKIGVATGDDLKEDV